MKNTYKKAEILIILITNNIICTSNEPIDTGTSDVDPNKDLPIDKV